MRLRAALPPIVIAALAASVGCSTEGREPAADRWRVTGEAIRGSRDLSALALVGGKHGLLASDETRHVQPVTIRDRTLVVGPPLELPAEGTRELDLEAATASETTLYVIGSHGATRGKGKVRGERFGLFALSSDDEGLLAVERHTTLRPLVERELAAYAGRPLQHNGTNIEGLAYAGGRLFAGFRGPSHEGRTPILGFDADAVFGDPATAAATTVWVRLGEGVGIRGMCAVPGGFLLLTGDSAVREEGDDRFRNTFGGGKPAGVVFWNGVSDAVTPLHDLDGTDGNPEAIVLLEAGERHFKVLVLHDGVPGGAPQQIEIARPPPR